MEGGLGDLECCSFSTRVPGVVEGTRCFGYYPMAKTLDVVPARVSERGFMDGAAHRATKAPIYNLYLDTRADPAYDTDREPEQVLFRPLDDPAT